MIEYCILLEINFDFIIEFSLTKLSRGLSLLTNSTPENQIPHRIKTL